MEEEKDNLSIATLFNIKDKNLLKNIYQIEKEEEKDEGK